MSIVACTTVELTMYPLGRSPKYAGLLVAAYSKPSDAVVVAAVCEVRMKPVRMAADERSGYTANKEAVSIDP